MVLIINKTVRIPGSRIPDATLSKTSRRPTAGDNWWTELDIHFSTNNSKA